MPIYEYRCSSCGHQQEFLQKVSDAPMTVCPQCGKPALSKMVTAAGFQLKGSGWYATDFKNKSSGSSTATGKPAAEAKTESKSDSKSESKSEGGSKDSAAPSGGAASGAGSSSA